MFARTKRSWLCLACLPLLAPLAGAQCEFAWQEGLALTQVDFAAYAAEVYDGNLYFGGDIHYVGDVIAGRLGFFDGEKLSPVFPGLASGGFGADPPRAFDLLAWDDGSGPSLFVAGVFESAGGVDSGGVARWDGTTWHGMAGGMAPFGANVTADVRTLAVFDDGTGPALYAGGLFASAGGAVAFGVAKWDGSTWSELGSGARGGTVFTLAVHDDGTGPALFAGGDFNLAGGLPVSGVAKWDGSQWSDVGGGANGVVYTLAVYDEGAGDQLFAGGAFTAAGGLGANHVARWDGAAWSDTGGGTNGIVRSLKAYPSPAGPMLYTGGEFTTAGTVAASRTAHWDGTIWRELAGGVNAGVYDFVTYDSGSGTEDLHCFGSFVETTTGLRAWRMAKVTSASWEPIVTGDGFDGRVLVSKVWDDGNGPALYVGGEFRTIGGDAADYFAKYDGETWSEVGGGTNSVVYALEAWDDGGGEQLYVGGQFLQAGGAYNPKLARWDGSSWSGFGDIIDSQYAIHELYAWDGLNGDSLYVGGSFPDIASTGSKLIGRFDGTTWHGLPGLNNGGFKGVAAMVGWDEGLGDHLYVGGDFGTAGTPIITRSHAKWDGTSWSPIGGGGFGGDNEVEDFVVWDDGSGEALYYGGLFSSVGSVVTSGVARYDGTTWSSLDSGVFLARDLLLWNDDSGAGERLFVGGAFNSAGGVPAQGIAAWNGSTFQPLEGGVQGTVWTMAAYDRGVGFAESLFVGGDFLAVDNGLPSARMAEWRRGCEVVNYCTSSPNSSGPGAIITVSGSLNVSSEDFGLEAVGATPTQFGLFYYGGSPAEVPFGDGVRCIGGTTYRLNPPALTDAFGAISHAVDFSQPPAGAGAGAIVAGATWYFQLWYRDPGGPGGSGFNLSNGVEVTFEP